MFNLRILFSVLLILYCFLLSSPAQGQARQYAFESGLGLRFAGDFSYFFRANEHPPLTQGFFSTAIIGPYFSWYQKNGGGDIGFYFIYKEPNDKFSLPLVMKDFRDGQNTSVTALEADFKVGPKFWFVKPKFGLLAGYRFKQEGFTTADYPAGLNRFYLALPLGASFDWPTQWGSTGLGIYYHVGLTNVLKNPDPTGIQDFNGSRIRTIHFEITVMMGLKESR
jgi:hypothetical protein